MIGRILGIVFGSLCIIVMLLASIIFYDQPQILAERSTGHLIIWPLLIVVESALLMTTFQRTRLHSTAIREGNTRSLVMELATDALDDAWHGLWSLSVIMVNVMLLISSFGCALASMQLGNTWTASALWALPLVYLIGLLTRVRLCERSLAYCESYCTVCHTPWAFADGKCQSCEAEVCEGCDQLLLDPDLCWCGAMRDQHTQTDNHAHTPIGCQCSMARRGGVDTGDLLIVFGLLLILVAVACLIMAQNNPAPAKPPTNKTMILFVGDEPNRFELVPIDDREGHEYTLVLMDEGGQSVQTYAFTRVYTSRPDIPETPEVEE